MNLGIFLIALGVLSISMKYHYDSKLEEKNKEVLDLKDSIELNKSAYGETEYLKDQVKEMQARINFLLDTFGLEEEIDRGENISHSLPNYITRFEHHYYIVNKKTKRKGK